ncbi:hypothetical protein G7074_18230 [Pedobacter sp. HDW13]|uniref:hypothetical protein n=1 Tax=Pedobacter sp. HDW13 TaxID=2714940 RepID=UPI00140749BD|nr:hypothetical protein [Pedobacter sp. HDW13]QIL41032.1 hypothetical protein G7074_18230 [Pedobacter sp. HDW13]
MRKNAKTVTKNYDTDTVNGWKLSYEYESENGAAPVEIRVTGSKDAGSVFITKTGANTSFNFNGGSTDVAVISSVETEISEILAGYTANQ